MNAATVRPDSIQYRAGLPLNRKAEAIIASAKTSDQRMGFLELVLIAKTVAWICRAKTSGQKAKVEVPATLPLLAGTGTDYFLTFLTICSLISLPLTSRTYAW